MAFKGTTKRTQAQLEVEVENMGMMLNAYTSRELTTYFAKCFSSDVGKGVEILSDLLQNPVLDKGAIEAERGVILREMKEVNDQPEEVVLDYLHATAYSGTSLGYTILGPEENIKTISQDDLRSYIDTHYTGPRMVLAAAGGVDHDELVAYAEQHFGGLSSDHNGAESMPCKFTGSDLRERDDRAPSAHVTLAVEGVGHDHPDHMSLLVASSIVGNWDRGFAGGANMASPLAQDATKYQFAHSYTSFLTSYSDTGLWGCYAVLPGNNKVEDFTWALQEEWMRLCTAITDGDVSRAKQQLKASMAFQNDGTTATCDEVGRQVLSFGKRVHPVERDASIEAVDVESVRAAAMKYIYDCEVAVVGVGPIEGLTDYSRIQGGMATFRV